MLRIKSVLKIHTHTHTKYTSNGKNCPPNRGDSLFSFATYIPRRL